MKSIKVSALAALIVAAAPVALTAQNAARTPNAPAAQNAPRANAGANTGGGGGGHSKREFLETYDANKDGKVSKQEFTAKRTEDHKGLDLNGNGSVNELEYVNEYIFRLDKELAERRARQIRQAHFRFVVLDTNKDGVLSLEEYNASGDRMFSRLDTTQDGNVDTTDTATNY